MGRRFFSSMTRISDLNRVPSRIRELPRSEWADGDYVVGEMACPPGLLTKVELPDGRCEDLVEGDQVMGALGVRRATLEAVGDWRAVGPDLRMNALTHAGLFGKCTSASPTLPPLNSLVYRGHVLANGVKATMKRYASAPPDGPPFAMPVVLLVGTSMSTGKTTSARLVIRQLTRMGLRVAAAKATGAARYGEILSMAQAGAASIFDFVDAGLPSTVCPAEEYRTAFQILLAKMAAARGDAAVIELGASPSEPYNGAVALEALLPHLRFVILCASDPYSVAGLEKVFPLPVDLVSGACTRTSAAVELIGKLTGKPALNLLKEDSMEALDGMLRERF